MQSGLINKVAIAPGNETDARVLKRVCPGQGAVYADKGDCTHPAVIASKQKGCHLATIKKNNMKNKNHDLDRWDSTIRAPYKRVFSQRNPRVRYRGIENNQFATFMQAMAFNLKRLRVLQHDQLFAWISGEVRLKFRGANKKRTQGWVPCTFVRKYTLGQFHFSSV